MSPPQASKYCNCHENAITHCHIVLHCTHVLNSEGNRHWKFWLSRSWLVTTVQIVPSPLFGAKKIPQLFNSTGDSLFELDLSQLHLYLKNNNTQHFHNGSFSPNRGPFLASRCTAQSSSAQVEAIIAMQSSSLLVILPGHRRSFLSATQGYY